MQKKTAVTPIQKALEKIRPAWVTRVGQELARGMEVRAGFVEQLERFFELLEQSVTTGDPAWMDPILLDWAKSSTETDLEEGLYHVSFLINRRSSPHALRECRVRSAGPNPDHHL